MNLFLINSNYTDAYGLILSSDLFNRFCNQEHLTLAQGVVHDINRVDYEVEGFVLVVTGSLIAYLFLLCVTL